VVVRVTSLQSDSELTCYNSSMPFLYIGNLGLDYDQEGIENDFEEFGKIRESWHWPTFGYCFFEYDSHRDAEDAIHEMSGKKTEVGKRMTVQWARRPRKHLPSRAKSSDKCYICNGWGHFARDCPDIGRAKSRSPQRRRSPPRSSYRRSSRSPRRRSPSPRRRSRSPSPRRRSRSPSPRYSRRSPSPRYNRASSPARRRSYSRSPRRSVSRSPDIKAERRSPEERRRGSSREIKREKESF